MDYTLCTETELDECVLKDEPPALYEKARRLLETSSLAKARPFLIMAATLGNPDAQIALAGIYEEEDNFEDAYELYTLAYSKGCDSVLPRLSRLLLRSDRALALEILKTNAAEGNLDCLKELVAILTEDGEKADKRELKFWKAKLETAEPKGTKEEKGE